jgi:hypothetical protein
LQESFPLGDHPRPGKRCSTCGLWKSLVDFNRHSATRDGLQFACRECNRAWHRANKQRHNAMIRKRAARVRKENQQLLFEYLLHHPCVDCGESDPVVLEFDHLRDKRENVAILLRNTSWRVVLEEIAKCEVRCANCHRRRTYIRANSWRTRADTA